MATHLTVDVVQLTNQDQAFYQLAGPWLANRDVHRDLGAVPWDDPGKIWWVALHAGDPAGMVALLQGRLCSDWVAPDYRRRGIYRRLFSERLAVVGDNRLKATCTPASLPVFLEHGFVEQRRKGRFVEVRRDG